MKEAHGDPRAYAASGLEGGVALVSPVVVLSPYERRRRESGGRASLQ